MRFYQWEPRRGKRSEEEVGVTYYSRSQNVGTVKNLIDEPCLARNMFARMYLERIPMPNLWTDDQGSIRFWLKSGGGRMEA